MRVLEAKGSTIALVWSRPARAVALAGVVGAALSLVPLLIAPDPDAARLLSFALLAVSSAALVFLGRRRVERVELAKKPSGLSWGEEPVPPPAHVALGGDATEDPPTYQAYVCWADGRRRLALERSEPGPLLRDAIELARGLELELRPGWGLERHLPATNLVSAWEEMASDAASGGAARVDLPLWPAQRRVAAITVTAGIFVLVSTAVLARSPERSVGPSVLELALPLLAACFGTALGIAFFGLRRRVELSASGIETTTVLFGGPVGKKTRLGPGPGRAFAVAPDRGFVRHVLFATSAGPISLHADPDGAASLTTPAFKPAVSERSAAELPLATSARYRGPDRPARLRS